MNKNVNNGSEMMKNDMDMREMYVKPECMVYSIETEGVLCASGMTVESDNFGGSFGNPRGW